MNQSLAVIVLKEVCEILGGHRRPQPNETQETRYYRYGNDGGSTELLYGDVLKEDGLSH